MKIIILRDSTDRDREQGLETLWCGCDYAFHKGETTRVATSDEIDGEDPESEEDIIVHGLVDEGEFVHLSRSLENDLWKFE